MSAFQPRIAITGGGPSGLALRLLLARRGIRATIYESRAKPPPEEIAKPSGMLDLHDESGLTVMRECGLWDDFKAAIGDCSEDTKVFNSKGELLHSDEGELSNRPEIPRNVLTDLFVRNTPSDIIKWNHKIESVSKHLNPITGATEIELDLGKNGKATFDFVVGADGAWSKVRKLVSNVTPSYANVQYMTATLRYASKNYPRLAKLCGSGTIFALGGGNGILTHRGPQDSIRLYAAVNTSDDQWVTTAKLAGKTAAEVKKTLLGDDNLFRQWAPPLQDLLASACDEETKDNPGCAADIKPLYMLPVGHRWEYGTGSTLLGDAAHLMTPFAGEGVNLALWDALDLSRVLTEHSSATDAAAWQKALEPGIREFEEVMLSRAEEKAEETVRNKDAVLSENGAEIMAEVFKGHHGPPRPE